MWRLNCLTVNERHLRGSKPKYLQINRGLSLDNNIVRYKIFFHVASELRVHKKGYKSIKCLFSKRLMTKNPVLIIPQYGMTPSYSLYLLSKIYKVIFHKHYKI